MFVGFNLFLNARKVAGGIFNLFFCGDAVRSGRGKCCYSCGHLGNVIGRDASRRGTLALFFFFTHVHSKRVHQGSILYFFATQTHSEGLHWVKTQAKENEVHQMTCLIFFPCNFSIKAHAADQGKDPFLVLRGKSQLQLTFWWRRSRPSSPPPWHTNSYKMNTKWAGTNKTLLNMPNLTSSPSLASSITSVDLYLWGGSPRRASTEGTV